MNMSDVDVYLGDPGTKGEFFLKLVSRIDKGEYVVNKLVDRRGREAMFYRYKGVDFDIEDCILIKATIVEHREFKSDPYTYLNRETVLDNKGSVTELAGVIRE